MGIPLRVLIIEDSEDDTALLLRVLKRGGFDTVFERIDTPAGLSAALARQTWDVILSDYAMPKFSAPAALEQVSARHLDLPFIIVSGAIGEDVAVAMMKAGAHDYLRKSNLARLGAAIEREVRDAAERRKRRQAEEQIHQYEGQLRSLASELSLAEARQRRLLASELHDGIGQFLVLAQIKLGELRKLDKDAALINQILEIRDLIDQAIKDTRTLTLQLSPPILYDLGLDAALKSLCEQFQNQHNLQARFRSQAAVRHLNIDLRVVLFQSVRELLRNVVRHAQAQSFDVAVQRDDDRIRITVTDDGVGMDPSTIDPHLYKAGSFGLFSIRERLKGLGGEMKIESPGAGTRVILTVPLPLDDPSESRPAAAV